MHFIGANLLRNNLKETGDMEIFVLHCKSIHSHTVYACIHAHNYASSGMVT